MTIETKFNIGDEVLIVEHGRAVKGIIEAVSLKSSGQHNEYETYDIVVSSGVFSSRTSAEAHCIFKTKEELIESLFN